jgi:hypothetical protein
MTIADLSTVWVTALVPEKDVAAVAKGQDAEVELYVVSPSWQQLMATLAFDKPLARPP